MWTAEQARAMSRKGAEASVKSRKLNPPKRPPKPQPTETDPFTARRLARVRQQLERVDKMLLTETDPAKLDRLAAASMRLSDQEFALANRPKPGQLRPTAQSKPRRAYSQQASIPAGWETGGPVQPEAPKPVEPQQAPPIQPGQAPAEFA